ncbi:mRNA decay activator protein zfp36 [Anaeramoeba flamelloides]|uniref:mRNA decay activator protein zfp36 n=1 Tax=Anaeramoeba flamelloides TaxID=1746091 RepID=A0AAV7YZL1_9EUKA|nr:mRNA decay activator protein zfp36 [Anaeramoeba flamelloides]
MTTFLQTHDEQEARKYLYNTTINIGAGSNLVLPKTSLKSHPNKDHNRSRAFVLESNKKPVGFVTALDQIRKTKNKQIKKSTNKPTNKPTNKTTNSNKLPSEKRNKSKSSKQPGKKSAKSNLYKTEVCRSWIENGYCKYGKKCQFAHGTSELRKISRHPKYKTQICKSYNTQCFCNYGRRCKFIHKKFQPTTNQPQTICKRLSFFQTICTQN